MENKDKIILDLCGGTGSWSRPYAENGYDVRIITLPENDVADYMPPDGVYGILAAPPCTEFSLAKNGSHRKRDFAAGMETVTACLRIIWQCQISGRLQFWALVSRRALAVINKRGLLKHNSELSRTGLLIADVYIKRADALKREGEQ